MGVIDDTTLFNLIRQGDVTAADKLVNRWHSMFTGFIARITGIDDAADIVQDTYLTLFKKFHTFKNINHARRFMYKTGYNRAIDLYRKKRTHALAHTEIKRNMTGSSSGLDSRLLHDLNNAVTILPAKEKAVIALKIQHDFTAREIAVHLGIPTGTVLYRIHNALKTMRHFLSSRQIQEDQS